MDDNTGDGGRKCSRPVADEARAYSDQYRQAANASAHEGDKLTGWWQSNEHIAAMCFSVFVALIVPTLLWAGGACNSREAALSSYRSGRFPST